MEICPSSQRRNYFWDEYTDLPLYKPMLEYIARFPIRQVGDEAGDSAQLVVELNRESVYAYA